MIGAKLEEPVQPCFLKIIDIIEEENIMDITREDIIDLETDILIKLTFDFLVASPIPSVQRFLRILEYDLNQHVYRVAISICKF